MAVEVRAEGVVAARAEDAAALLTAVAGADIPEGAVIPGVRMANVLDKDALSAAIRRALDEISARGGDRGNKRLRDVTVVVPDSSVRVLFLDFDQLPSKPAEALPVVRFRLKKLLPFEADDAAVSYQTMSSEAGSVRVLAVAMPRVVLEEYENAVLAAGYLPGAVIPSTLAALAGLDETAGPALFVNACLTAVTSAIVKDGTLILHRSDDRQSAGNDTAIVDELTVTDAVSYGEGWDGLDGLERGAAVEVTVVQAIEQDSEALLAAREAAQEISVAAAYFEDSLGERPEHLLAAGTLGADALAAGMEEIGLAGLRVRELPDTAALEAGAATARVPRGWLAGVRGALKN